VSPSAVSALSRIRVQAGSPGRDRLLCGGCARCVGCGRDLTYSEGVPVCVDRQQGTWAECRSASCHFVVRRALAGLERSVRKRRDEVVLSDSAAGLCGVGPFDPGGDSRSRAGLARSLPEQQQTRAPDRVFARGQANDAGAVCELEPLTVFELTSTGIGSPFRSICALRSSSIACRQPHCTRRSTGPGR
jgi:hypothetical protein